MVRSGCPGGRASLAVTLPSLKYTLVLVITQNFSLAHILPPRSSVFLQDHALPKPRRGRPVCREDRAPPFRSPVGVACIVEDRVHLAPLNRMGRHIAIP